MIGLLIDKHSLYAIRN